MYDARVLYVSCCIGSFYQTTGDTSSGSADNVDHVTTPGLLFYPKSNF